MGARKSFALTEEENIKIKNELLNKDNQLKYIYDLLVYTGIRLSDWNYLVDSWNKCQTKWLNVFIPKQSNRMYKGSKTNRVVTRQIMLSDYIYKSLLNNDWKLNHLSDSTIKKEVNKIQTIANNAGISRKISPHDLRATFINMLKHRGYDIWDIMNITQHSSVESLAVYFSRDTDVTKQAFESLQCDRYDSNHPKLLAKENQSLKDEIKILRARLKEISNGK